MNNFVNCIKCVTVAAFISASCTLVCSAQVRKQVRNAGDYTYKTECLGVEGDGSMTVLAWGNGRNRSDAVEQALKNAVNDVLFFGILEGKPVCENRPLVPEINAREKYEKYFNKFFDDGGLYSKFVSLEEERVGQSIYRNRKGARESVTNGFVVRVNRSELKKRLIKDGILK